MGLTKKHFSDSTELCNYVADETGDACLLSFSCGKDSIAAWLRCKEHFKTIVPFFLYLVPDLEFVEQGIRYYEDFFKTPIIRLPHPSLFRMLNNLTFQPPERCLVIEESRLPSYKYEQLENYVRTASGLTNAYVAIGTRTADSPTRLANVKRFGPINHKRKSFLPVYDWRMDDVVRSIQQAGCKLTVEYKLFGRSFDGIDYRFLGPITQHLPRDYERILQWFPLAELEIFRRECSEKKD